MRETDQVALLDGYELADRYRADTGRVFVSGSQALARVPLAQLRADRLRGLRTAAFVSGYPGSPLANYDRDAAAAAEQARIDDLRMVVQPALNEELAAGAVMGTQLAANLANRQYDGVIGVWYGKSPGLDRAGDALRHATFAGTSAVGGAVAMVGDDPNAKSSTLPSASEMTLLGLRIPMLFPGDVQEAVELGRHAIALSRASGLWTAVKIVESVADGTGTVDLDPAFDPEIPVVEVGGRPWTARASGNLITPHTLEIEREFHEVRLDIAVRYGTANALNRVAVRGPDDWLGVVASGYTARETRAALEVVGLADDEALRHAGVRLIVLGMPAPLDPQFVRDATAGLAEVLVIEEKNPMIEWAVKDTLYGISDRPLISGRSDPSGEALVPRTGLLVADTIAPILRRRLLSRLAPERLAPITPEPPTRIPLDVNRTPYFCSGCPHNTSTQAPHGALVGAGIGCHTMAMFMDPTRVGDIVGVGAMGIEGTPWLGIAPFVSDEQFIQNLGDGTLFHSGILAVRAVAASGVNITYKILYNGAVAMTGGQNAVGSLAVPDLCRALLAEGVREVLITTDDPRRYRDVELPDGVKVWGRSRIIEAQEHLATVAGCTALIHDQRCAAELRRDRRRGTVAAPTTRVLINARVCEGCGHCADVSNCLSVQPISTPYGRKTAIHQHSCNLDMSCLDGDCPAFATVTVSPDDTRSRHSAARPSPPALGPSPVAPMDPAGVAIRLSGIGGTGVVTVSQVLGTAAMLEGLTVRGLDQTGLSQKAGPVVSDLRITRGAPSNSNRAARSSADLLLAFDQLGASSDAQIGSLDPTRTVVVANTAETPTGAMVTNPDRPFPTDAVAGRLAGSARSTVAVPAVELTRALLGDDTMVNVFLTGVAAQLGHLPMTSTAIERAIELNGVSVERNQRAFAWGRAWADDPVAVTALAGLTAADSPHLATAAESVGELIDRLADDLRDFQSRRVARRFRNTVNPFAAIGHDPLTEAVARNLHKLVAYKDEYEVARLLLLPEARAQAEAIGGRRTRVTWRLHPPALRAAGVKGKIGLGRSARPMLVALRAARRLRGTPFDPFGMAKVRRVERAMIPEYEAALDDLAAGLATNASPERLFEATRIAALPDQVRGYEHLKLSRAETYRAELARSLATWHPT